MYRVKVRGIVVSISEVKLCERTGFAKRQVILQDPEGYKIAPEFHPKNFQLLTDIREGDVIQAKCRLKVNKMANAHFLVVDEMNKE